VLSVTPHNHFSLKQALSINHITITYICDMYSCKHALMTICRWLRVKWLVTWASVVPVFTFNISKNYFGFPFESLEALPLKTVCVLCDFRFLPYYFFIKHSIFSLNCFSYAVGLPVSQFIISQFENLPLHSKG
jgi:hypothetical protein